MGEIWHVKRALQIYGATSLDSQISDPYATRISSLETQGRISFLPISYSFGSPLQEMGNRFGITQLLTEEIHFKDRDNFQICMGPGRN